MKKAISLLLLLVLLLGLTSNSFSEEFTLHNGTTFGMTRDEVIETEAAAGFTVEKDEESGYLHGEGMIANQADTGISYHFDEKDALFYMYYSFSVPDTYDVVEQGLIKKYGPTDYNSETGLKFPHLEGKNWGTVPFDSFINFDGIDSQVKMEATIGKYSHRLIDLPNGQSIFIEHYTYSYLQYVYGEFNYSNDGHYVKYRLLDENEANAIKNMTAQSDDL